MKRLLLVASLVLCMVSMPVSAQDKPHAERPTLTVGDTWNFRYEDKAEVGRKGSYAITVTAIDNEHITYSRGKGVATTTLDLNEIKGASGRTETPHSFSYVWPLEVGKEWPREITWTNGAGGLGRSTGKRKVVAYEKVTVPAGTFDAFVIEFSGYYNDDTQRSSGAVVSGPETTKNWYAPAVKGFVKYQRSYRVNGRLWEDITTELQSYSIQ